MSDKKHIDRLFQEGFKDFEATPNDAVWKNIEAELNQKKKKRRVIPIWWRYAGVAALLLLLLTIGGVFLNNSDKNSTNQVVDTENTILKDIDVKDNNPLNDAQDTTPTISDNTAQENLNKASNKPSEIITNDENTNPSTETSIAETSASKKQNENKYNTPSNKQLIHSKKLINPNTNAIANSSSGETHKFESKHLQTLSENSTQVANTVKKDNTLDKSIDSKNETPLINKEDAKSIINGTSKENSTIAKSNETLDNVINTKEENKRSIEDAINDSEDFIEKGNTQLNSRWSIAPNAAPVYFNTLGDGSSIDPQFNNNSKSGDVNMSYGISTSYAINKKLSIRSGVHSVNLGYNTNDVAVFQNVGVRTSSSALQNVSNSSNNVSLISTKSLESDASESIVASNASINQNLRYFEVPLEIQYKLSDSKLGINVIGGFSSFFLNTSKVFYEEDNGNRTILGEANNINKVSYSANFGLGLNYKVSKRFDLNLEPIFKYQFNTFNNTSGNFTPFLIGVYTGLAIKF